MPDVTRWEDLIVVTNLLVDSPIEIVHMYTTSELSPKRKLLRDRVKLITSLTVASSDCTQYVKTMDEVHALRDLAKTIRLDKDNHFLSYSQEDKGMVSYSLKPQHKYDNDRRHKTTLGRYVRKQLKVDSDTISDRALETLSYVVVGELANPDDLPIEVINGEAITEAYEEKIGGETCMAGDQSCYTRIYEMNPGKVAMIIYDGRVRALLWTTDEGVKIMDRIYPNEGSHIRAMKKWAESKGYLTRNGNYMADPDDTGCVLGRGKQYHVTLKHNDVFPYMDTFMHGQINDGHIVVSNLPLDDEIILQEQDGTYCPGTECCHCDEHIPEDEVYNIDGDNYCESCYYDRFTCCVHCSGDVDRHNIYEVDGDSWCEGCANDHATSCEDCSYWHTDTYKGDDGNFRCEGCHQTYEESQVESAPVT